MKIISKFLENPINFSENSVQHLVIENAKMRASFLEDLLNEDKDVPHLIEDELNWLNFSKESYIVSDYLNLSELEKKISTKFISNYIFSHKFDEDKRRMMDKLLVEIQDDIMDFEPNIYVEINQPSFEKVLKSFDISFIKERSIYDNLYELIKDVCFLDVFSLLILINPSFYLKDIELEEIEKIISYSKVKVLVIDNLIIKTKYGKTLVIDDDFNENRLE